MDHWPHAPLHQITETGAYMVTAGTYQRAHFLSTDSKLALFQGLLFELADKYQWRLQAWAILNNHYHFLAISPESPESLRTMLRLLHSLSAQKINAMDQSPGRRVWFQYWDSLITYQRSYLARLHYVHQNPVHHGIVKDARDYQWGSASWFELNATPALVKTAQSFKIDRVKVFDDF